MNEDDFSSTEPLLRVMSLHALAYCERLFYLEEVEEIRVADASVYAGRTLHEELALEDGEERRSFLISSEALGLTGKMDAVRHREGAWVPYEHKRGRPMRGASGEPLAWESDALQVSAYGMLLEEFHGKPVHEGRVRYHADNFTVRVPLDGKARSAVLAAIARARALRAGGDRPPIAEGERRCLRCSLAPVCLPEEERLVKDADWEPVRLFPPDVEGKTLHITGYQARLGKSGEALKLEDEADGVRRNRLFPVNDVHSVVIHGSGQITTQALQLCAAQGVAVHWFTGGGSYVGGLASGAGGVQRRLRQYAALTEPGICLSLARRLVRAKVEGQLRFLLRATRGGEARLPLVQNALEEIRRSLRSAGKAESVDTLRGIEGMAGRAYFGVLGSLLGAETPDNMRPNGRNRRPPKDRFNAILSFGYSMLYKSVLEAILAVGLEPSVGFMHTPRSSAHPLVLDLIELFRTSIWDMTVIASINRRQWDPSGDFAVTREKVWLSPEGRKKAIGLFERRLQEQWKHPVTDYSLSYRRTIELEVRLLEKEWSGQPGLFARARIR